VRRRAASVLGVCFLAVAVVGLAAKLLHWGLL